jgi:8-oxo-dGTP pyrophosphatase MutT (NUDIX family)
MDRRKGANMAVPCITSEGSAAMSAALAERLRVCLADAALAGTGAGVAAAVLVPVLAGPQPALLFTHRRADLVRHAGQVSFPGGRSEAHDTSPLETALRETEEETGIASGFVIPAGYLARRVTVTGFDVQPVVGVLRPGFALVPDEREVAEIFTVPLAFFRDPANRREETRTHEGVARRFHSFRHGGHEIWGATAAILVDLITRLDGIEV